MNNEVDLIKKLTITALLADEILVGLLVLKGGNAIDIVYDLSNRGSIDIDFSMEKDFTEKEMGYVRNQISGLLNQEFSKSNLTVFDVKFIERPKKMDDEVKAFWGGYNVSFKVIEIAKYQKFDGNLDKCRRNAIPISSNNSTIFEVDISKYEYVKDKIAKDLDGQIIYVYSPEMLALEKLRALCQQNADYIEVVYSMTAKSRARDFYDIHNLVTSFSLNLEKPENLELIKHIFEAKRVPLVYLSELPAQYELHKGSWESVLDTININETPQDFDYYFDFVNTIATLLHSHATRIE